MALVRDSVPYDSIIWNSQVNVGRLAMLCTLAWWALVAAVVWYWFVRREGGRVSGVYSEPGRWFALKYAAFRLLYALRQRRKNTAGSRFSSQQKEKGRRSG